jgi:hypothetical protein
MNKRWWVGGWRYRERGDNDGNKDMDVHTSKTTGERGQ